MSSRISRRGFLAGSASFVAVVSALHARRAGAAGRTSEIVEGPYGPLRETIDLATGLPLILLPEGFPVPNLFLDRRCDDERRTHAGPA
jgi:hypothetical protein